LLKHDHTDHCRTTQPQAGQGLKYGRGLPGILVMALGGLAVVSSDAYRSPVWAIVMGIAAIAAFSAGASWVLIEGRRVGRVDVQWLVEHPDGPAAICTDAASCRYFAKIAHPAGHSSFFGAALTV
jgi:hypothetical protein